MAYTILASFGVSLDTVANVVVRMLKDDSVVATFMCLAAAANIRANVTFIEEADKLKSYPEFFLESSRDGVSDRINFKMLHVAGHLIATAIDHKICKRILKKAGSCITGEDCPNSEAGKINKEIANEWSTSDVKAAMEAVGSVKDSAIKQLDMVKNRAEAFKAVISAKPTPAVVPPAPPTSGRSTVVPTPASKS